MSVDLGEDPLALDRQVCFALSVASRGVIAAYRPLLRPLNLTHPQYLVMLALWERSPRTVKELATVLRAEPATLSPLLKRLETVDYVSRERRRTDERVVQVALTGRGHRLRAEAEKIPYQVVEALGLPLSDLEQLRQALEKVLAATSVGDDAAPAS